MSLILPRRAFLAGLGAVIAAPAIVRADSLMKLPRPEIIRSPAIPVAIFDSGWPQVGSIAMGIDPAQPLLKMNGERVAAGDLRAGTLCVMVYDGARWRLTS